MERARLPGHRGPLAGARAAAGLAALLLAMFLLVASSFAAAPDNTGGGTYEERAAAERMSRSRYRNLEVASLVVILVAGGCATYWAVKRRKS